MPRKSYEVDGYHPNELSLQLIAGANEPAFRARLGKMRSIYGVHQIIEGEAGFGSVYILEVNPPYLTRLISNLRRNAAVGLVGRVALRDLA